MKIKILIKTTKLPVLYRHRVVALIKEALAKSDETYKNRIYGKAIPKAFTFNVALPLYVLSYEPVQIDENFTPERYDVLKKMEVFSFQDKGYLSLWLSTADYEFLIHLFNGLVNLKEFMFSGDKTMLVGGKKLIWEIKKVVSIKDRNVKKKEMVIKTCSPILVEKRDRTEKKKLPLTFNDSEFVDVLNVIMDEKLKLIRGYGLREPLIFKPLLTRNGKLLASIQKVKHTLKEFREETGLPYMTLTVNKGLFYLKGHPDDVNWMLRIGVGNRTGQGFGMVEVVK